MTMRFTEGRRFALGAGILAIGVSLATPLLAQDKQSADGELGDIVVTAQRRAENLQDVPIAIAAVEGGTLAKLGVRRSEELSIRVPSLTIGNDSNIGQPYIRGVGSQYSWPGLDPSVSLYVDGGYVQRQAGSILEFVDIKNVQVLKGPQGTLYGRNATGGAILIEQNNPQTSGVEGYVFTEYGRFNDWRSQAVLNLPVSDTLAVRFAGQYRERDGFIHNVLTGKDEGGGKSVLARGKLQWTPNDALTVRLTSEYFRDKGSYGSLRERLSGDLCLICNIYGFTPPEGFYEVSGRPNLTVGRSYSNNLTLIYQADAFTLTSITTYRDTRFSADNDNDFSGPDFLNSVVTERGKTFVQDVQLSSSFDGMINFLAGAFYERDRARANLHIGGDATAGVPSVETDNRTRLNSFSVYGEAYVDFAPDWRLTGGLRYNRDSKKLAVANSPGGSIFGGGSPAEFGISKSFSDVTQRAVIAYKPGNANYYVSYNKGFKSGGFNTPTFAPVTPLNQENLTSLEVGAKNSFMGGRLRTEVAVFHYWYDDLQVSHVDFNTGGIVSQNAASARTTGVEGSVDAKLSRMLSLGASGTYLHSRFKDFEGAAIFEPVPGGIGLANGSEDLSGHRMPYSPTFSGSVYGTLSFDLKGDVTAELSAVARYTSGYDFSPGASGPLRLDRQDAFTIVNLNGTVRMPGGLSVGFYVNNLTGRKYYASAVTAVYAAEYHPAAPRTFGGSIRYDF